MKLLVFGDIHNGPNFAGIEAAISAESPEQTIFLGDYFDQWGDTPFDVRRTAIWLKESLQKPNRIHLWGNHDLPYASLGSCPGWSEEKNAAVRDAFPPKAWEQLRLWYHTDSWLFSHAGLSRAHSCIPRRAEGLPKFLDDLEAEAWSALHAGQQHWVFAAGRSRGGSAECGGPLWCDLSEFKPIDYVNQVFGHTPMGRMVDICGARSRNWCIDVSCPRGLPQALVIDELECRLVPVAGD